MSGRLVFFIFLIIAAIFTYLFLTNGFSSFNLGSSSNVIINDNVISSNKVNKMSYMLVENITNYDNKVSGNIVWFDDGINPSLYPSKKLLSIPIVDGFGSISNTSLDVNHNYTEYFDGEVLYYDYCFGSKIVTDNYKNKIKGISKIGIIRDLVDENNKDFFFGNTCFGENKTTKYNKHDCQLYSWKDSNKISYNIKSMSGGFSFPITIMSVGSNSELKDLGLSVKFDKLDKPEGNEYISVSFDCIIGCTLIDTSKDYTNWWKNQETIKLGTIRDGLFEQYMINIRTVDILIGEDSDIWYLVLNDLDNEKDIFGDEKALPQIEEITAIYR